MTRLRALLALIGVALVTVGAVGLIAEPARGAGSTPPSTLLGEGDSFASYTILQLQQDALGLEGGLQPVYLGETGTGEDGARLNLVNGNADFTVTGAPLTAAEAATATQNKITTAYVPYGIGGVAIVAALSTGTTGGVDKLVTGLQLTMGTVAEIFTGTITQWTDPIIVEQQTPAVQAELSAIPAGDGEIQRIVRADTSATTSALIASFLASTSVDKYTGISVEQAWVKYATNLGVSSPSTNALDRWPADPLATGEIGGTDAVLQALLSLNPATNQPPANPSSDFSISYISAYWAQQFDAPQVAVTNLAGKSELATPASIGDAISTGTTFDTTSGLYKSTENFDYSTFTDAGAYPIPLPSYLLIPMSGGTPSKVSPVSGFVTFAVSSVGQNAVTQTGMVDPAPAVLAAAQQTAAQLAAAAATTTSTSTTSSSTSTTSSSTSTTSTSTTSTTAATGTATTSTTAAKVSGASGASSTTTVKAGTASDPGSAGSNGNGSTALPVTGGTIKVGLVGAGVLALLAGEALRVRGRLRRS